MTKQTRKEKTESIVSFIKTRCDIDGKVSFARVCLEENVSPATLYGYVELIQEIEPDISFKDKEFMIYPKVWKIEKDTTNIEKINREKINNV